MQKAGQFMIPAAIVAALGMLFCMVSAIAQCEDFDCVVDTAAFMQTKKPKDGYETYAEKIYFGWKNVAAPLKLRGKEYDYSCPHFRPAYCEYEYESAGKNDGTEEVDYSKDCETKEKECWDNCEEYCKDPKNCTKTNSDQCDSDQDADWKCQHRCEQDERGRHAMHYGFSAGILCFFFFLILILLSLLRAGPMNNLPIKIIAIVFAVLTFIFSLAGFAAPIGEFRDQLQKDMDERPGNECNDAEGSTQETDCEIKLGPAVALLIVAWLFTLVPLICHAALPHGLRLREAVVNGSPV